MLRIVVADDEEDVILMLGLQLDAVEGIAMVGTARDGSGAIEQCRALRPDAVVMDLLMPNVSGFEAIEVLQREMPELAVVAYSGVAGNYVREEMARLSVPLVLKSGDVLPLVRALREATAE